MDKAKVLILGAEGYLGRALYDYLWSKNHRVFGVDNGLREMNVATVHGKSLIPVGPYRARFLDVTNYRKLKVYFAQASPDAIVHFAEQPSAPFSMIGQQEAVDTQRNNTLGTLNVLWAMREVCPNAHLIKLGTMGVYGTPDGDIPETNGPVAYDPASFYHNSKAFDSINIRKACQWWGLHATDLHQGVVYGHIRGTRFDYDSYFGTAINRFLVQALVNHPLTVYGAGGQTRGFININDTLQCIELAINNPAIGYRVFNQITDVLSISALAEKVRKLTGASVTSINNPRYEKESHYYKVTHEGLKRLGLKPRNFDVELERTWQQIQPYRGQVLKDVIIPQTTWS